LTGRLPRRRAAAGLLAAGLLTAGVLPARAAEGYAQPVTSPGQQARAQSLLQGAAAAIGLPARFESCRLTAQVAAGVANGEIAYGAICKIAMGNKPARDFAVCTAMLGGGFGLYDGAFVDSTDWVEHFIRANCF
jgi:hypothetical protein